MLKVVIFFSRSFGLHHFVNFSLDVFIVTSRKTPLFNGSWIFNEMDAEWINIILKKDSISFFEHIVNKFWITSIILNTFPCKYSFWPEFSHLEDQISDLRYSVFLWCIRGVFKDQQGATINEELIIPNRIRDPIKLWK